MDIILANQAKMTLSPGQEGNTEFQKGLAQGKTGKPPAGNDGLKPAGWIGFWTEMGLDCCKTADEVREILGP